MRSLRGVSELDRCGSHSHDWDGVKVLGGPVGRLLRKAEVVKVGSGHGEVVVVVMVLGWVIWLATFCFYIALCWSYDAHY